MSITTVSVPEVVAAPAAAHRPRLVVGLAGAALAALGVVGALAIGLGGSDKSSDDYEVGQYGDVGQRNARASATFGGVLP